MTARGLGKRWLFALVALGVLVAAVGIAASVLLRSGELKSRIEAAAFRATGRQVTIAGKVRPLLSFTPGIVVTKVDLANIPGGSRPQMAVIKRMEIRLALLPLLRGQVEITRATLVQPDVLLERNAAGQPNWLFHPPEGAPGAVSTGPHHPHPTPHLETLVLQGAHLTLHHVLPGRTAVLVVPQLSVDLAANPIHLRLAAQLNGVAVAGDLQVQREPFNTPYPVQATLAGAGATLAAHGTFNPEAHTLEGEVAASAANLASLSSILAAPLPALHDLMAKATFPSISLSGAPLAQPAQVEASGSLPNGVWHVAASLRTAGSTVVLRGLQATAPVGDVAGDIAFTPAPRPTLRGTLVSTRLDMDAVRALWRQQPAQAAAPSTPAPATPTVMTTTSPSGPPRLFSDKPLPWHLLDAADADLQLSAATLQAGGATYHNAAGHFILNGGALTVSPFSVTAPEGPVALSASVDARPDQPAIGLALHSPAFAIGSLLQSLGLPAGSSGAAELDVVLNAAGNTPHALASTVTGHAGVALVNGAIANADLAAAMSGPLRSVGLGVDPGGQSAVRCLALRLNARSGQVSVAALMLDTSRLTLTGGGTVNLGAETLALQLRPVVRVGVAEVAAPLQVGGPLLHPAVAMESPTGELGRSGITIGGVAGPPEDCDPELTAARDGRAGPMPTPVASKPVKPADLLRSLLR